MPRRIPDYPDAYLPYNEISSYGSILSVVSSIYFFYVVYNALAYRGIEKSNTITKKIY